MINMINVLKLDTNKASKDYNFLGAYENDNSIFQQFKFYGSIDLRSVNAEEVTKLDLAKNVLILRKDQLPRVILTVTYQVQDCLILSETYCALTDKSAFALWSPNDALPDEIY